MRLRASMLPRRKDPIVGADIFSGSSSLASGSSPWPIARRLGDDDAIYYKLRNLFAPARASDQPLEDEAIECVQSTKFIADGCAREASMQIAALATNGRRCGATSENREGMGAIEPLNEHL